MDIWLLTVGEPWPTDPGNQRLLRAGTIAQMLAERGHDVTWWSSTFDHNSRTLRSPEERVIDVSANYRIIGLSGPPYERNVSFSRIANHRAVARSFWRRAPGRPLPNVITASMPTIELAEAGVRFASKHNIASQIDIRDLWPDIWTEPFKGPARLAASAALLPFQRALKSTTRLATSICAVSDPMVDWALAKARRKRSPLDQAFLQAYRSPTVTSAQETASNFFWTQLNVPARPDRLTIAFVGTLVRRNLLADVVRVLAQAPVELQDRIHLVIAGTGEAEDDLRAASRGLSCVTMAGWIDRQQIWTLLRRSHFGLLPYPSGADFSMTFPNKFGEYVCAGLPVISCTTGVVASAIEETGCGALYDQKNPKGFIDILQQFVARPLALEPLRLAAKTISKRFDVDDVYGEYCNFIERLGKRPANEAIANI